MAGWAWGCVCEEVSDWGSQQRGQVELGTQKHHMGLSKGKTGTGSGEMG